MSKETSNIGLEFLEAMRGGADHRFPVTFKDARVIMRPLTIRELNEIAVDTAERMSKLPEGQRLAISQSRILTQLTLVKASTSSPEKYDPTLTAELLDRMYPEELTALYKEYCAIVDRVNPMLELLEAKEVQSLIDGLKKNHSTVTERSFWELANVCRVLIQETAPTDK